MYGLRIENLQDDKAALPGDGWMELGRELKIGRGGDNALVLDDPVGVISKHHCTISNTGEGCVLTDHSRNGSFLNGGAHAVEKQKPIALKAGDFIQIGHYVLTMVGASAGVGDGDEETDVAPMSERSLLGAILRPSSKSPRIEDVDVPLSLGVSRPEDIGGFADGRLTPEDSLMLPARPRHRDSLTAARPDHAGVTSMVYVQPRLSTEAIPDDWDILSDLDIEPAQLDNDQPHAGHREEPVEMRDPPPAAFAASEEASREAVLMFLEGCGLQAADLEGKDMSTLMLRAGQALKVTIANFQEELAWKDGVDLPRRPDPAEINPLKFTRDVRDVTLALLAPDTPGFLVAHEAIDQAFDEVRRRTAGARAHMARRMRTALEQLAPEVIESRTAETLASRYVPIVMMAKHWKLYCKNYPDVVADVGRFAAGSRSEEGPDETGTTGAETSKPAPTDGIT
jgi:type VI secretion system FHA domain protein